MPKITMLQILISMQRARRGIDEILENWGRPDVIMLDPPRSGAGGKVMR